MAVLEPFHQVDGFPSHWTRGSPRGHLGWEEGSGAVGHMVKRGFMPRSPCLDLKLVCIGTRSVGYDICHES
jgi:hypothetical protein